MDSCGDRIENLFHCQIELTLTSAVDRVMCLHLIGHACAVLRSDFQEEALSCADSVSPGRAPVTFDTASTFVSSLVLLRQTPAQLRSSSCPPGEQVASVTN